MKTKPTLKSNSKDISKDFRALCKKYNIKKSILIISELIADEKQTILTCSKDTVGKKPSEISICSGFMELMSFTNGIDGKAANDLAVFLKKTFQKTDVQKLAEQAESLLSTIQKK